MHLSCRKEESNQAPCGCEASNFPLEYLILTPGSLFVYALGFHVTIIVHFLLVVLLKWLLLGRFKAGVGGGLGSCLVRLLTSPDPNTALEQVYNRTFNLRLRVFLVDFAGIFGCRKAMS